MVVVHSEPSTSAPHRKNRRKLSKKASKTAPREHDEKMVDETEETIEEAPANQSIPEVDDNDGDIIIDTDSATLPAQTSAPSFPPLPAHALQTSLKSEMRRVPIPPHRFTPLKKDWINIFGPLTEILGLQVRMNVQRKSVEIRASGKSKMFGF